MVSHPVVSYPSLNRAGRALKAFSLLYLPFYGLSWDAFFSRFGLWAIIEAMFYEADELNEGKRTLRKPEAVLLAVERFLRGQGLFDAKCRAELANAEKYFSFERSFRRRAPYTGAEVLKAAALRSFDFRLLHRLLWKTMGRCYDERVFLAFHAFEELMELDDDLPSLEKDTRERTFNVCAALLSLDASLLLAGC